MKLKYIIDKEYDKRFAKGKEAKKIFNHAYDISLDQLKQTQKLYQKSWDKINKEFSDYIEKKTGYKWFYPVYFCVVSVIIKGSSNWGYEPKIMIGWKDDFNTQRRVTAHELVISHYFEIYNHYYSDKGLSENQVWALAEIAGFALLSLIEKARKFWPWDNSIYSTKHNYPQIVDLQNKLKEPFLKRKNFDEYIEKGIELAREYKDIGP